MAVTRFFQKKTGMAECDKNPISTSGFGRGKVNVGIDGDQIFRKTKVILFKQDHRHIGFKWSIFFCIQDMKN